MQKTWSSFCNWVLSVGDAAVLALQNLESCGLVENIGSLKGLGKLATQEAKLDACRRMCDPLTKKFELDRIIEGCQRRMFHATGRRQTPCSRRRS